MGHARSPARSIARIHSVFLYGRPIRGTSRIDLEAVKKWNGCAAKPIDILFTASQYWSLLMTSPPPLVPRAHQVSWLIELLMNCTWPSAIRTLTPPGWKLSRLANTARLPDPVLLQCVH